MNNEPVAWMSNGKEFYVQENYCPDFIPLYIHPADESFDRIASHMAGEYVSYPAKTLTDDPLVNFKPVWQEKPELTLTDEEIMVLYEEYIETQYASESNVLGFGRAILRKAQEK
jgi:hypothetical protein